MQRQGQPHQRKHHRRADNVRKQPGQTNLTDPVVGVVIFGLGHGTERLETERLVQRTRKLSITHKFPLEKGEVN